MYTQLITMTIPLPRSMSQIQDHVVAALKQHGEPLRWSITKVQSGCVYIEAIVTGDTAV